MINSAHVFTTESIIEIGAGILLTLEETHFTDYGWLGVP